MKKNFIFIIICLLIVTGCSSENESNKSTIEDNNWISVQENNSGANENNSDTEENNNYSNSSGGEIDEGGIY